ncbi:hypothetical protein D030_5270, partial [Vibrio parahaemolyticus AQ3810]
RQRYHCFKICIRKISEKIYKQLELKLT